MISSGRPGKRVHRHVLRTGDLDDALADLSRRGRDGDEKLIGAAVAEQVRELLGCSQDADAVKAEVLLARVVVDEPDRRVAERRVLQHLAQDQLGRVAGADDDDLLAASDEGARGRPLDQRAGEKARAGHEGEQEEEVDDPDAARDARGVKVEQREDEEGGDGCHGDATDRPPHVLRGHVAPPAVVEAEGDEDRNLDREDESDHIPLEVAVVVDRPPRPLEAQVPREHPGRDDQPGVHADLPEPVPVDRGAHRYRMTYAGTPSAARTVSTTRSCCSAVIPAHSGTEKFSLAARSVSGRSPSE